MVTHKASEDNSGRWVVSGGVATRKDKGAPPPDSPTRRSARNAAAAASPAAAAVADVAALEVAAAVEVGATEAPTDLEDKSPPP
jgi:hypothetical protein